MKRFLCFVLCLCLAFSLAACGSSGGGSTEPKDYAAILTAARPEADGEAYVLFQYKDGAYTATGGYASELTQEDVDSQASLSLQMLGLETGDVQEAVFSVSLMNVQSYGMAIVKPAEGKADTVKEALRGFIESQKSAQQNYLPDQYAIAKAARLETMKSGELVLVMREGQDDVLSSIQTAFK